jgi:hypothetical protein
MSSDISEILGEWPYDQDRTLRIIIAADGRSVLQVRLPLGMEQYELDGRPDGAKPYGRDTVLDEFETRLQDHIRENGSDSGFTLSHDDFTQLQNEGILFYYRYLMLFQISDFEKVARDTEHNLRIAALVDKYSSSEEDRVALLQYKPYMIRMNSVSRSMLLVQKKENAEARGVLKKAIDEIKSLSEIDSPAFQFEKIRSINYMKTALKQIENQGENPAEELKLELERAVQEENYEKAAELRDRLQGMQ